MALRQVMKTLSLAGVAAALGCTTPEESTPPFEQHDAGNVPEQKPAQPPPQQVTGGTVAARPPIQVSATAGSVATQCGSAVAGGAAFGTIKPVSLSGVTVKSETPPPPISGGTMLTTADGSTIVAADPERDQIYFVDATAMKPLHTRALTAGDQPGRVVEDAAGRIHVVLRGAHAIATLERAADSEITRRDVCAVPRGIAYDADHDLIHVACAEGKLVTLNAAPSMPMPTRTLDLGTDARDVIVRGDKLFVTRFRSAELLVLNADGELQETRSAQSFSHLEERVEQKAVTPGSCEVTFESKQVMVESTPNVAWRAVDVPGAGVAMLHQRSRTDEIMVTPGGYGAGNCGAGIVQTAVTMGLDTQRAMTGDLGEITLAVDIAVDSDGEIMALAAPGNQGTSSQIQILPVAAIANTLNQVSGANPAISGAGGAFAADPAKNPQDFAPCMSGTLLPETEGQVTAVTFASPYVLAALEREPAGVTFYDLRTNTVRERVSIEAKSTFDTGHTLFHTRAGAGIACASCHPEAGDDGHTWTFATIGARRTQTLRGGILGTEPLHWNGDMKDFSTLMKEVFVGRMAGFAPSTDEGDALAQWLDRQPSLHAEPADKTAAERGKMLFESKEVGCSSCHAGAHLTNNATENVGTGADLQVPSLKGVRFRTPLMHDGCAANLSERFTNKDCGGGDKHGRTSQLDAAQIGDLTAYLETL